MDRCSPRRLAIYGHNGLKFSETMEVAEMVMTGRHRRVPIIRGHLGSALYRQRVIFGGETVEVRDADRSAFGGIFGIREYPAYTTPRQFESLLAVDFAFVLTQSFTFSAVLRHQGGSGCAKSRWKTPTIVPSARCSISKTRPTI
jgi:type IV secretion system protein VirB4